MVIKENVTVSDDVLNYLSTNILKEINSLGKKNIKKLNIKLSFKQGRNCYKNGKLPYYNS